jgi:hypothetical protein
MLSAKILRAKHRKLEVKAQKSILRCAVQLPDFKRAMISCCKTQQETAFVLSNLNALSDLSNVNIYGAKLKSIQWAIGFFR